LRIDFVGLGLLIGLMVGTVSCAFVSPREPIAAYSLTHVSGNPLPALVILEHGTDGTTAEMHAVDGRIRLFADGRFDKSRHFRNVWTRFPKDTLFALGKYSGTYERRDTLLTLRFIDEHGTLATLTYTVLVGGKTLRGAEGIVGTFVRVYEYRQD
jgi:hypothetical protein